MTRELKSFLAATMTGRYAHHPVNKLVVLSRLSKNNSRMVNLELTDRFMLHINFYISIAHRTRFLRILGENKGCITGAVALAYARGHDPSDSMELIIIMPLDKADDMLLFLQAEEGYMIDRADLPVPTNYAMA